MMAVVPAIVVSWIATRCLAGGLPLSVFTDYRKAFQNAGASTGWTLPWEGDHSGYSHYWSRSAGTGYLSGAYSVSRLWDNQVPLRWMTPPPVQITNPTATVTAEATASALLFPTGIAVLLTVTLSDPGNPAGVQAVCQDLDQKSLFRVDGGPTRRARVVVEDLLARAEEAVLGHPPVDAEPPARLPTLATVTSATGWAVAAQDNDTHRTLVGLSRLAAVPADPGQLGQQQLAPSNHFTDTVRVVVGDGGAIAAPGRPTDLAQQLRMRCYHQNCVLTLAQTSVLLDTAIWVSQSTNGWLANDALRDTIKQTVVVLGLLNGPGGTLFRTRFARRLIQSSELIPAIDTIRQQVDLSTKLEVDPPPVEAPGN